MDWVYQNEKDIMAFCDWGVTVFDIVFADGTETTAIGHFDEDWNGGVTFYLEDQHNGYEPLDTDTILKWKIK